MSLRRTVVSRALRGLAVLVAGLAVSVSMAQPKPLRILVGFPPGGGTDAIARTLSERLADALGVPVVVDNRPGAGGQIAAQVLKASPADGTTVFLTHDHTISILPLVVKNPGYQPDHDFVPVAGFATFVNAFAVSGGTPAKSFEEYVQWVRTQGGGKGAVGIPAPASTPEFLVKLVGEKFHLDLVSAPYRGAAPMMADMLGNQIGAGVGSVQDFMENHKAGKLRVVAVLGSKRQAAMPRCLPSTSWVSRGLQTCRTTAFMPRPAHRRSSSTSLPWRWPRWWASPGCATSSLPWASRWVS